MFDKKIRNWCATFFQQPHWDDDESFRYAIFGEEICPKTKKTHWQSYIEFDKPVRMSYVKKIFNDKTIHLEPKMGTREEARDYCKKNNKFTEYGKWTKGQGHRSDLDNIIDEMKKGKKLTEIMIEHPKTYCQYRNGLKDISAEIINTGIPAFRKVETILLCGPTGCGKTRLAMESATYKIQGSQLSWWQDYNGDKVICIDEYNNDMPITDILALLDGYKLRLNIKGSHTYAAWDKVYITTNLKIDEIHTNAKEAHRNALFRRITKIINFWDDVVQG